MDEEEGYSDVQWRFGGDRKLRNPTIVTIASLIFKLRENINNNDDDRPSIPLGHGDPSVFPSFRTTPVAEEAVVNAVRSAAFNSYTYHAGLPQARRSVAEYLSGEHDSHKISADDIYITLGATQAINVVISVLARPGANILLPRPGFPLYEGLCDFSHLETRFFELLPENGWEVDLDSVEALADERTVGMSIINPGNPCGNVYSYEHLEKIAQTARKLGILVISDEAYAHLTYEEKSFVPMGVFGSIVPVITLGSLSKRWMIPGWRIGWIAINDTARLLHKHGIIDCIQNYIGIGSNSVSVIQAAIPDILEKTPKHFYSKTLELLREGADMSYRKLKAIPCIICPYKPAGSMFIMAKLNLLLLEDIDDDMDFCLKLASEESVIVLPGFAVGLKNWVRVTFAVEKSSLEDGLDRIKAFCLRHAKK